MSRRTRRGKGARAKAVILLPDPAPVQNPLIDLLHTHYAQYLQERPAGALTAREIVAQTGRTYSQVKAFLANERAAGNIKSARVIRARGGGVDTVYWRVK